MIRMVTIHCPDCGRPHVATLEADRKAELPVLRRPRHPGRHTAAGAPEGGLTMPGTKCTECGGGLPKGHRLSCSTRRDEVWRVYRFEKANGEYAEVASNHIAPDQIALPPGYKFVASTPLVIATEALDA